MKGELSRGSCNQSILGCNRQRVTLLTAHGQYFNSVQRECGVII